MADTDEAIVGIHKNKVGEIVQQYINWDDATDVRCEKDNDGTWKIVAR